MSDLSTAQPATEAQPPTGFFANLIDLYFAPGQAFANMMRKPAFVLPMAVHLVLSIALWGIWLQKADLAGFIENQRLEAGRSDSIPADRLEMAVKFTRNIFWGTAVLGPPLFTLIVGGVFLFVFRFFYASDVTYRQSLTIVASSAAAVAFVTTPLLLGVVALKGEWSMIPPEVLQANLTLLFEKKTAAKWLWALSSSLDLFIFWLMFLFASGFGAASKRNWSWALPGIVVPWAMVIAIKVAIAAFRG